MAELSVCNWSKKRTPSQDGGVVVGDAVVVDGSWNSIRDGVKDGNALVAKDGYLLELSQGVTEGIDDGIQLGMDAVSFDGDIRGTSDGTEVGIKDGIAIGTDDGGDLQKLVVSDELKLPFELTTISPSTVTE